MIPVRGLILAAGASRRMGRPKALLEVVEGRTFLGELAHRLREGGCQGVWAVVGADAIPIARAKPLGVRLISAMEWSRGMRASLRAGLRGIPAGAVVLTHVDRPLVDPGTISALARGPDHAPLVPTWAGRPGHPVRIPSWLRERLLASDDVPLRDVLQRASARRMPVADPGVLLNLNTPDDLARLQDLRRGRSRLI